MSKHNISNYDKFDYCYDCVYYIGNYKEGSCHKCVDEHKEYIRTFGCSPMCPKGKKDDKIYG